LSAKSSDVGHQLIDSVCHSHCLIGADLRHKVRQRVVDNDRRDFRLHETFGHLAFEFAIRVSAGRVDPDVVFRGGLGFDFGRSDEIEMEILGAS